MGATTASQILKKLRSIEYRLDAIEGKIADVDGRFKKWETRLEEMLG